MLSHGHKSHHHVVTTSVPSKLCACTQVMIRAHTRKLGTHRNVPSKNVFAHISYTPLQIQMNSGKMLHKRNLCTHRLEKSRGNIGYDIKREPLPVFVAWASFWRDLHCESTKQTGIQTWNSLCCTMRQHICFHIIETNGNATTYCQQITVGRLTLCSLDRHDLYEDFYGSGTSHCNH